MSAAPVSPAPPTPTRACRRSLPPAGGKDCLVRLAQAQHRACGAIGHDPQTHVGIPYGDACNNCTLVTDGAQGLAPSAWQAGQQPSAALGTPLCPCNNRHTDGIRLNTASPVSSRFPRRTLANPVMTHDNADINGMHMIMVVACALLVPTL